MMHSKLLSATIAAALIGAIAPVVVSAQNAEQTARDEVISRYLVSFSEPGLLEYLRQAAPAERFTVNQPAVANYRQQLMNVQAAFQQEMNAEMGRVVDVSHYYLATHSGMAVLLSAEEADVLRKMPGVASVKAETFETIETQRGPSFIGADTIWSGVNVPNGADPTRGEGMVLGVLDGGAVLPHPSFNNDSSCGHDSENPPKIISALDCSSTDVSGLCNGPSAQDTSGHGTHTASTSGGNTVGATATPPPAFPQISGVAPCASLRIYKICPDGTCPGADIQGGLNSVLLHGDVDVVNFSVSGGTSPWTDNDRLKLDLVNAGVMVAASAGNTRTETPNPIGAVNHRGPWVLSVAASTHDQTGNRGTLTVTAPGTPPAGLSGLTLFRGSDSPDSGAVAGRPMRHFIGQTGFEGCTPGDGTVPANLTPIPANFFSGSAALIHRGGCSFTQKITNAFNAGANFVIVRNNAVGAISMSTPGQPAVPAYSVTQASGNALVAFVDANPASTEFDVSFGPVPSDELANFSLRGPTPGNLADLQKPNITGPGVNIYAATVDPTGYGFLSGTSMSSPHLAGAATLIRKLQPNWSPIEVMSAIQMTAVRAGLKDTVWGVGQWDADDVGSGRIDLTKAALTGLLMDESFANFLAANPALAGDVKTLNTPSVRDVTCEPVCTFTRTVRSVVDGPALYTVAVDQPTGFTVVVAPTTIALNNNESQVLTITVTPNETEPGAAIRFGAITMTSATGEPQQHMTVAVRGAGIHALPEVFKNGFEAPTL